MNKVLVIEDDPHIIELLKIHLHDLGCEVDMSLHGTEGYELVMNNSYQLIVLDLMLPGMSGLEVCQKLRARDIYTPILMLTAKSEEFDKVMGLESGADDYLTKPFGIREFIARVKAILRREERQAQSQSQSQTEEIIKGKMVINRAKRKVMIDEQRVDLTPKEFDLLLLMAENPGTIYNREVLLSRIWGYEFSGYEHTVNSHINRLRNKIEPDLSKPTYIKTVWGAGYSFNDEI